jgi:hypothetical protein
MSIILRTLKGSALTYEEMDRNMSQYFYSSSVHDSGTELRLHYTGSDSLDTPSEDYGPTRYQAVTIGSGGGGAVTQIIPGTGVTISPVSGVGTVTINASGASGNNPGGSDGSVQFRSNSTTFGGNSDLFYNATTTLLGLGTNLPESKLHIVGNKSTPATVRVATAGDTSTNAKAQMSFYNGTTKLGEIGKTVGGSTADSVNIFLQATNNLRFQIASNNIASVTAIGLGIFNQTPNRQLVVQGADGIGVQKGGTSATQSIIRPIPATVYQSSALGASVREYGVMLSGPLTTANSEGGHVVVSLSQLSQISGPTDSDKNSFSIISSRNESYSTATSIACFRADQKVGIVTNDPQVTLDVNGQIRGKYEVLPADETNLGINLNKVSKVTITGDTTFLSTVPAAGTEATIIIVPSIVSTNTVTFNTTYFKTQGTLAVAKNNTYTVSFVSDGSYWYETGRVTIP